ncbi:MAG: RHS repeat-associated core domain-containing protein [Bacteriovoracaceae bacterium]|nr:RHS repeat-associated core domain-containing protein [Bacteriovoracaceae bacterium]
MNLNKTNSARYYDPSTGRFLSEDPIGFSGGDYNLYRYVGNNPVTRRDPFGLYDLDDLGEALDNAREAVSEVIKKGKEDLKRNLDRLDDWWERIIDDSEEQIDKADPTKEKPKGSCGGKIQ